MPFVLRHEPLAQTELIGTISSHLLTVLSS